MPAPWSTGAAVHRACMVIQQEGRFAVNLRLTEPEAAAAIPIDHFDGLVTFDDLPRDGRSVSDCWF